MKLIHAILPLIFVQQALYAQEASPTLGQKLEQGTVSQVMPHNADNESLRNEVQHSIDKAIAWLKTQQTPAGFWDMPIHPALTGLVLTAIERDPSHALKDSDTVKKGYAFVVSCAHPDGGIYKKNELLNYNTSVCVMALLAANDPSYDPILIKARKFLVGQQMPSKKGKDNTYAGGIGYGDDDPHSDMSNMVMALEALHATEQLKGTEKSASKEKDLNWNAAIDFVQRCQNLAPSNKAKWVGDEPKNKGGFVYTPTDSAADSDTLPDGREVLRSYGSMSYAGLLSYIYTGLKHDDPRVTAVIDWARNNYSVDENPAMGQQGVYYYYQMMAKAFSTYGVDKLKLADGKEVDWKSDLSKKLINLQHADGSWVNDNGRFWEKDPVLVTAYSVLALEMVYQAQ
ncbi:MAG: prenyltransferase/squalene oxidase repeat-containing protein [Chthoniobacteraceae bacterium]